jgi:hypothetical protein
MTYPFVCEQLPERLAPQLRRAWRRWLHPDQRTPVRRPLPVAAAMHRLRQGPLADTAGPCDRKVGPYRGHRTRPEPSGWPHLDTVAGCGGHRGADRPAMALRNTAAVRAPVWGNSGPHLGGSTAVAGGSSGPGPGPAAPARVGMSSVAAARITCVSTLVAGVQSSAGHPSGPQSPQTPGMAIDTSLPRVPDTSRPDSGRSGSSGRSIR